MFLIQEANRIVKLHCPKTIKVKLLCELVREIPYKILENFNPSQMLKEGKGSCTPKHIFLASYLKKIGVPFTFLVISFHFKKANIAFPRSKLKIVHALPLTYHIALKVKIKNKFKIVDVTWDSKLKGFPINNLWDGESDMILGVTPEKIFETSVDPRIFTKTLKQAFTPQEKEHIKKFVLFFNDFLEKART